MLFWILGINIQVGLSGEALSQEKPKIEIKSLLMGEFQENYAKYFSENYSLRSVFIKTYNQMLYTFKENKNGIIIGNNNYLIADEYVAPYLSPIDQNVKEIVSNYARQIKHIQDNLEANNKAFIYIISPSKAEVYSEVIPNKYITKYKNGKNLQNFREYLYQELKKNKVNVFDTYKLADEIKNTSEYGSFSKTGIHWNSYLSALASKQIIEKINQKYDKKIPIIKIIVTKQNQPQYAEMDLYNLYNMWKGKQDLFYPWVSTNIEHTENKLNAFIMGGSFSAEIMKSWTNYDSNNQEEYVFNSLLRYFYFRNAIKIDKYGIQTHDKIYKEDLDNILKENDIIIIESNASYLPESHIIFAEYLYNHNIFKNLDVNDKFTIDFTKVGNSSKFILYGFHGQEDKHRWASENAEIFFYSNNKNKLIVNIKAYSLNKKTTKVFVNDQYLCNIEFNKNGEIKPFIINTEFLSENRQKIRFETTDAQSPKELGLSEDDRRLSLYIERIEIAPLQK